MDYSDLDIPEPTPEQYHANLLYQLRDPNVSEFATIDELEKLLDELHRKSEPTVDVLRGGPDTRTTPQ